jgi:hypothetical protein
MQLPQRWLMNSEKNLIIRVCQEKEGLDDAFNACGPFFIFSQWPFIGQTILLSTRVTRLAEFLPVGQFLLKMSEGATILGYYFHGKNYYVLISTKKRVGLLHFGRSFHRLIWPPCCRRTQSFSAGHRIRRIGFFARNKIYSNFVSPFRQNGTTRNCLQNEISGFAGGERFHSL